MSADERADLIATPCGANAATAVDFAAAFAVLPTPCVIFDAEFVVRAINEACLEAVGWARSDLVGRQVFAVFPDNPNDPGADGVRKLRDSLQQVLETGAAHSMEVQRYDIAVPGSAGVFQERYWSVVDVPIVGADGVVQWILHRAGDVTEVRVDLMRALEFYRRDLDDDHGDGDERTRRFTEYAAASLSNAHLVADVAAEVEQMRQAMASRAVIEQAKGIVMGERRCSPDDAFAVLVQLSQDTNRKLRDVAAALVATAYSQ